MVCTFARSECRLWRRCVPDFEWDLPWAALSIPCARRGGDGQEIVYNMVDALQQLALGKLRYGQDGVRSGNDRSTQRELGQYLADT